MVVKMVRVVIAKVEVGDCDNGGLWWQRYHTSQLFSQARECSKHMYTMSF